MSASTVVVMPRLSDSMEEGTVVRWLKGDGDEVQPGDELVEIETDKAIMTYEAESAGVMHRLVAEGETVALGSPIAELLAPGESPSANGGGPPAAESSSANAAATPAAAAAPTTPRAAAAPAPSAPSPGHRVAASPVARRLAQNFGIDLASIAGTGPRGRIVKRDVEAAGSGAGIDDRVPAAPRPEAPAGAPAVTAAEGAKGAVQAVGLTRVQTTVARRMSESRATVPDFSVEVDVRADALVAVRDQLRNAGGDPLPSYNDFIVKACALALRAHPRVNGAYRDGGIEHYGRVNIGIAVAAEAALVVPIVADADEKSLGAIARETLRLSERARDGGLTSPELSGGTFTVSNLGMFGVTRFSAIVNQPQAAILAVGALEQRPVVVDGEVRAAHVMTLTLCADHRILYGADAAAFLATVRTTLEAPLSMLL